MTTHFNSSILMKYIPVELSAFSLQCYFLPAPLLQQLVPGPGPGIQVSYELNLNLNYQNQNL